ncbi:MAG TPA: dienelactone hydrolase family protein [Dehalococcoidia bacterium]|nr:dienelactone hydrolase family protein [Dehalococcoidia bacterium]
MRRRFLLVATLIFVIFSSAPQSGRLAAQAPPPASRLTPVTAPSGTEGLGATWYTVPAPNGRLILTAVFDPRPDPTLPSPAIVLLHGSHGFAQEYVTLAQQLAQQTGYVTAAGCWFGGAHQDASDITPIACPQGPDFVGSTAAAWPVVDALDTAVSTYAGGSPIILFGHSRGAEVAVQMASNGYSFQAVVSNSGVYDEPSRFDQPTPYSSIGGLKGSLLVLHGTADPTVPIAEAERYLTGVQQVPGTVSLAAHCYTGGGHDSVLHPTSAIHADAVQRIAQFVLGQLPYTSDCPPPS